MANKADVKKLAAEAVRLQDRALALLNEAEQDRIRAEGFSKQGLPHSAHAAERDMAVNIAAARGMQYDAMHLTRVADLLGIHDAVLREIDAIRAR